MRLVSHKSSFCGIHRTPGRADESQVISGQRARNMNQTRRPLTRECKNDVTSKIPAIESPAAGMRAGTPDADGRPLLRTAPSQAEHRRPERAVRLLPAQPVVGPDVLSDAWR